MGILKLYGVLLRFHVFSLIFIGCIFSGFLFSFALLTCFKSFLELFLAPSMYPLSSLSINLFAYQKKLLICMYE